MDPRSLDRNETSLPLDQSIPTAEPSTDPALVEPLAAESPSPAEPVLAQLRVEEITAPVSSAPETAASPVGLDAPRRESAHPILYPGLTWLLGFMVGVVLLRYFVPHFAEEIQYSLTRGEQRAKYDLAGERLTKTSLDDLSHAYQMVSQRVSPSVVHIGTMRIDDARTGDEENQFQKLFGRMPPRELRGQGSGVIVDPRGYILTNHHVVYGVSEVYVQLSDGRKFTVDTNPDAKKMFVDADADLALLKFEASNLTAADWGDSETAEVGSLVWAVGSPFGLDRSITSGILSAKHRRGIANSIYQEFLQTDAAVNPGNSGGPLVDVQGRVIGINTAIIGDSFQGISFALPSSIARRRFEFMKQHGVPPKGWLGLALEDLTPEKITELGLASNRGILIPHVVGDGRAPTPAFRAGIKTGDVLIRWDGRDITERASIFSNLVASTKIGQSVDLVVLRGGNEVPLTVVVGERPQPVN
jgi:serine protease Do